MVAKACMRACAFREYWWNFVGIFFKFDEFLKETKLFTKIQQVFHKKRQTLNFLLFFYVPIYWDRKYDDGKWWLLLGNWIEKLKIEMCFSSLTIAIRVFIAHTSSETLRFSQENLNEPLNKWYKWDETFSPYLHITHSINSIDIKVALANPSLSTWLKDGFFYLLF